MNHTEYIIPVEGSLGLLALGDEGLREWRKVRDIANNKLPQSHSQNKKNPASNFQPPASTTKLKTQNPKLLLIGWDAADWKIINPLLDAGEMPALERLINNGVVANLATLDPPISPMLWTSIATGKMADKHGILGFVEPVIPRSDNQTQNTEYGIRPVTVTSRKAKAIWNILNSQGKKCNVVGWWPSFPAEPLNGVMVSDIFNKVTAKYEEEWKIINDSVYPENIINDISDLRVHPAELTQAHILPFVPDAAKVDQTKYHHLAVLAKILAEAASLQAITTCLLKNTDWDFTAVYFDSIDHFCHAFMRFYPPKMKGLSEELFELYRNIIPAAYKFHDMMLDRLVSLAGENTTVVLISDHGFHSDKLRPVNLPNFAAAPIFEHNPYGICCISGNNTKINLKKDERIYGATLLDICPTILNLFDLPVGKDMDGKVLTSIFQSDKADNLLINTVDTWENAPGNFGTHPSEKQQNAFENSLALNQLVELGYIEEPGKDIKADIDKVNNEAQYNLSRVYISRSNYKMAVEILENLYNKDKNDIRFNLDLATAYLRTNDSEKAIPVIQNLRNLQNQAKDLSTKIQNSKQETTKTELKTQYTKQLNNIRFVPNLDLLEGMLLIKQNKVKKGIALLKQAEKSNPLLPNIHMELGKSFLQMNRYKDAKNAFLKAIDIDEGQAGAYHGLAVSLLRLNKVEDAVENILTAIGMQYHFPAAHYHLGEALFRMGKYENAEKAFSVCLKLSPDFPKAQIWLHKIHSKIKAHANMIEEDTTSKNPEIKITNHEQLTMDYQHQTGNIKQENINFKPETLNLKYENLSMKGEIIIVSGLPRSGTSMMMNMLQAGGLELLTDYKRMPDNNNPVGYFEYMPVKNISKDNSFLIDANGKAVKIVAHLLQYLPDDYFYKIIFMQRDIHEVIRSQQIMLGKDPSVFPVAIANSYKKDIERVHIWADKEPNVDIEFINYTDIINDTARQAESIKNFLSHKLDVTSMLKTVNPDLYRNKL